MASSSSDSVATGCARRTSRQSTTSRHVALAVILSSSGPEGRSSMMTRSGCPNGMVPHHDAAIAIRRSSPTLISRMLVASAFGGWWRRRHREAVGDDLFERMLGTASSRGCWEWRHREGAGNVPIERMWAMSASGLGPTACLEADR